MQEQERKKKRRTRTLITIALTVAAIGVVIGIMFAVDSCEQKIYLDMGQTYEEGDRSLTPTDMKVFRGSETLYVFLTLEGGGVSIDELALDGEAVSDDTAAAERYGFTLFRGEELNGTGVVMFAVKESGKESELTYRKAVFRVGRLTPQGGVQSW